MPSTASSRNRNRGRAHSRSRSRTGQIALALAPLALLIAGSLAAQTPTSGPDVTIIDLTDTCLLYTSDAADERSV